MKPITEAEAARLVCPFTRRSGEALPASKFGAGNYCIGPRCMLWQTAVVDAKLLRKGETAVVGGTCGAAR